MFEAKFCAQRWGMTPVAISKQILICDVRECRWQAHQRGGRGRAHQHLGETAKAHAEYTIARATTQAAAVALCAGLCARQWFMASPLQLVYIHGTRPPTSVSLVSCWRVLRVKIHALGSFLIVVIGRPVRWRYKPSVGAAEWVLKSNWWCCWRERLGHRLMDQCSNSLVHTVDFIPG